MVGVLIDTVAVLFIQLVEAFIATPIWIFLYSEPINLLILPGALEFFAIRPRIGAETVHDTVSVVARIDLQIWPSLHPVSISLPIFKVADECHAIGVALFANAFLDILTPLAFVNEEIDVPRYTLALSHVIDPFSLIGLALHMGEFAVSMSTA